MMPVRLQNLLSKRSVVGGILLLVCGLRFVNLGFGEIQEWDEALYAVRAKSIVYFGDWLDQTNHAVGGLYSASHPPLFIWLTAITYKVFGINNYTTRLWSAIFGSGLILLVYLIARLPMNRRGALLAAVLLGTIPIFTFYSRQGQLDVAFLFFLTASVYSWLLFLDRSTPVWLILSGITFGLSLATKSASGILAIPVIFSASLLYKQTDSSRRTKLWLAHFIYAVTGVLIVLPWYIHMEWQPHPGLRNGFFVSHVLSSVQDVAAGLGTNVKELGLLFFPNQLIVRFPLSGLAFAYMILTLGRLVQRRGLSDNLNRVDLLACTWFLIVFIIYSLLRTKVISYLLPMLIPASLLTASVIERMRQDEFGRKLSFLLIGVAAVSLVWSISDEARNSLKSLFNLSASIVSNSATQFSVVGSLVLSLIVVVVFIAIWRNEKARAWILAYLTHAVLAISILFLIHQVTFVDESNYVDGAEDLSKKVSTTPYDEIVYLHTPHYTGGMNPQLAYYLDGINCGWNPDKRFIEINRAKIDSLTLFVQTRSDNKNTCFIVEKNYADRPEKSEELLKVEGLLAARFERTLETKRYILYSPRQVPHAKP
jgi:4-amino-4-deoxy-L-arabinose transferase-like glycosyltransferase